VTKKSRTFILSYFQCLGKAKGFQTRELFLGIYTLLAAKYNQKLKTITIIFIFIYELRQRET